mgnify:FL=1
MSAICTHPARACFSGRAPPDDQDGDPHSASAGRSCHRASLSPAHLNHNEPPRTALRLSERADHCATGMLAPQPTRAPCNAALNACDPLEELKHRIAAGRRGAHRIRDDRFYPEIRLRSSSTTITGSTTRCINQVRCVVEQVEVSTVAWATLRRDWHLDETFLRTITSTLRPCVDVSTPLTIFNKSNSSHQSTSTLQETLPQPSAPP